MRSARLVERYLRRHPEVAPWQTLNLDQWGLTPTECETAVQWIGTDGTRTSAHLAVARTLVYAGKGWSVHGRILLLPGVRTIAGVVYRWVARNRHRLPGGTAQCSLPASERTQ